MNLGDLASFLQDEHLLKNLRERLTDFMSKDVLVSTFPFLIFLSWLINRKGDEIRGQARYFLTGKFPLILRKNS